MPKVKTFPILWFAIILFAYSHGSVYNIGKEPDVGSETDNKLPPEVDNWEFLTSIGPLVRKWLFLSTVEMPWAEAKEHCVNLTQKFEQMNTAVYKDMTFRVYYAHNSKHDDQVLEILKKLGIKKDIWEDYNSEAGVDKNEPCHVRKWLVKENKYSYDATFDKAPCWTKLRMLCAGDQLDF